MLLELWPMGLVVMGALLISWQTCPSFNEAGLDRHFASFLILSPFILPNIPTIQSLITGWLQTTNAGIAFLPFTLIALGLCLIRSRRYGRVFEAIDKYNCEIKSENWSKGYGRGRGKYGIMEVGPKVIASRISERNVAVVEELKTNKAITYDVGIVVDVYLDNEYLFSHRDIAWFSYRIGVERTTDPLVSGCSMAVHRRRFLK